MLICRIIFLYTGMEYGNLKKACLYNPCRRGETVFKLVIVEDEDNIRHSLESFIPWEKMGFQVAGAFSDGSDALTYLRENPCDVVLTDILMSRMSGLEMIQQLHQIQPRLKVVILSGHSDFGYAQQAIRYQVAQYLVKPVDEEELMDVFQGLKEQLDSEAEDHIPTEENRELKHLLQKNFLRDLLSGSISAEQELDEYLKLLGFAESQKTAGLVSFEIKTESRKPEADASAEAILEKHLGTTNRETQIIFFESKPEHWQVVFLGDSQREDECFRKSCGEKIQEAVDSLKESTGCDFSGYLTHNVLRMTDLLTTAKGQSVSDPQADAIVPAEYKLLIVELDLNAEATLLHILKSVIHQCASGDMESRLRSLYAAVEQNYKKRKIDLWEITGGRFHSNRQFPVNDSQALAACVTEDFRFLCYSLKNRRHRSEHNVIERVVQYLDEHLEEDISHEAIAAKYRLHPGYLSRLFKQEMGETLSEYLLRIKIERAAQLLKEDRYKIGEIARMVGYSTSSYFSVMFKKYTGCTPREYCQRVSL